MSFYLYLNIFIIAFPLIFSFERKWIKFYKKIKPILISLIIVGILFISWDIFATSRGHWSFNPEYVNGIALMGLPIEEMLFFITVPYSCLFVFESILHLIRDSKLFNPKKWTLYIIGALITFSSAIFYGKEYTFLAIISVGLTVLLVSIVNFNLFIS